ncbi:MAG: YihY/virulence factor BrkB family protein [Lachnospiraceae bacterium]|jgi:membrane protein|nr:YihY/virulence factor BrkB family protein [Lachnospiraceae bacterium]
MVKATYKLIKLFDRKIQDDHIQAYSAQAAFFIIISFFPFIMLLFSIIKYFPITESSMLKLFTLIFPSGVNSMVVSMVTQIYDTTASGTLISVTAITTLWSAGKGFLAIMKGLNRVYEIKETRNYIFLRATSALYTLIFAIMVIITMILFVFGNRLYLWIERQFPVLMDMALVIISLRTIVGLITLVVFFLLIYIVIPNRKTKIMQELPGALLSAAGWMGFSYAFSYYIDNFSNFSATYGSLTAIVLFMLWMYFLMYILFIGAECNRLLENKIFVRKVKKLYQTSSKDTVIHR